MTLPNIAIIKPMANNLGKTFLKKSLRFCSGKCLKAIGVITPLKKIIMPNSAENNSFVMINIYEPANFQERQVFLQPPVYRFHQTKSFDFRQNEDM